MPKITKRIVEDAAPGTSDYFLWCDELPGFGVRIYPSGKRGYLIQYRADGRSRRVKIGLHGALTADEARRQAKVLLGEVAKGGDPAEERATKRAAMTVAELCSRYIIALEQGLIMGKRGLPKKALTIKSDLGRINAHIIPLLGKRRVRELTPIDVARLIRDVSAGSTAQTRKTTLLRGKSIVTGGRGAAARTAGLLGGILSYAVSEGIITANPATGVRKPGYQSRTTRLSPDEYRRLGKVLEGAQEAGVNDTAIAAIRLLALSGCRKGEIVGLQWGEVDAAAQALRLTETKEGRSIRPIGHAALDVLARVNRDQGSKWVLPGERRDLPYGGLKGVWRNIIRDAALPGMTIHGLRHAFASVAGDLGFTELTIAGLLGHASGSVTSRYMHLLDSALISAANRVSETIAGYMGAQPSTPDNHDASPPRLPVDRIA